MLPLHGLQQQQPAASWRGAAPHSSRLNSSRLNSSGVLQQCARGGAAAAVGSSSSSLGCWHGGLHQMQQQQQQQLNVLPPQPAGQGLHKLRRCLCARASGATSSPAPLQQQQQQHVHRPQQQQQTHVWALQQLATSSSSSRSSRRRSCTLTRAAAGQGPPDPWQQGSRPGSPAVSDWGSSSSSGGSTAGGGNGMPPPPPPPPGGRFAAGSGNGTQAYGAGGGAAFPQQPVNGTPNYAQTDWGWSGMPEDWDPAEGLAPQQLADLERDYEDQLQRRRTADNPPRDKWITPLLDWQSIYGAFDPDQSRTEDAMADEALTNKEESREALSFVARLVVIPLITGAIISKAIADPVLSFSLQNNPNAFALTEHQKLEGAQALHMEETRVKMMMAIGQIPPLDEGGMLQHLHEYALEFQEEEREKNEANLITLVSDSISAMVFFVVFVRDNDARQALFSTIGRLFAGLSDIAKAVLIILVADTLLGYHSEEGWTGFLDIFLGHYGVEVEEEDIVLFVGIIPIAIDVLFKYWIFIGLNRISPGAVVTIKQLDRH